MKRNIRGSSPVAVEARRFECATLNTSQRDSLSKCWRQVSSAVVPIHGRQKNWPKSGSGRRSKVLGSWAIGCRDPWQAQLIMVQVRKTKERKKQRIGEPIVKKMWRELPIVFVEMGRLKRSLGDNKKQNPVREVCGREKSLWQWLYQKPGRVLG